MTKTLDFAYETPQEVKVGDDETTFTLVCKNEDRLVNLTTATSITVKIGDRSGYLRGQQISIDSLANLQTGQFNFSFGKDTLANLPTGNYFLEVWVADAQGTSIYPSGIPLSFTVTANIENSSGASITTITFDDFVKAMNKAASTIAKGDKGDTGTVDNDGLINAPAFQSLQTQVDNSAVGTNLLTGTSEDELSGKSYSFAKYTISGGLQPETTYTLSGWARVDQTSLNQSQRVLVVVSSADWSWSANLQITPSLTSKYNKVTFTAPTGKVFAPNVIVYLDHPNGDASKDSISGTGYISKLKLEEGSVATDWCLNPSEILTQSDYAKIKAAIVALGGALS